MPVVAMDDLRAEEIACNGKRGVAERGKSSVVVPVIDAIHTVQAGAVIEEWNIDEVVGHAFAFHHPDISGVVAWSDP